MDRVSPAGTVCTVSAAVSTCPDSGRTASTAYSYNVRALVQNWVGAATVASGTTSAAANLVISSVVRSGGQKKVNFTGTGAVATTTITVTICSVNSFPCASPVATSIATTPTAGNWTSAQDNSNLNDGTQYFAQAVQGSTTSAAFPFTVTGL